TDARAAARSSASRTTSRGTSVMLVPPDEVQDGGVGRLGLLRVIEMPGPLEEDEFGAGDPLREEPRILGGDGEVLGPVQHEGRDVDTRETVEAVEALHRLPLSPSALRMFRLRGS